VALCKAQGLKVGLASASPLRMLEKCSPCLNCATSLTPSPPPNFVQQTAPAGLSQLRRQPGRGPDGCVALEDSVNGMIASKAARMRSIVVPEAENSHDPRFVLADVKLTTLESLTASDFAAPFGQ
jgi:sugar-phosphatase